MSTGSADTAPAWFLDRATLRHILTPLDDVEILNSEVARWRDEHVEKYRGWFHEPPAHLEDFSVEASMDWLAESFCHAAVLYLPTSRGGSPRRALVLLNRVAKLARACSRPRTRVENEKRRSKLRDALENAAADSLAQAYFIAELHFALRWGTCPSRTRGYLRYVLAAAIFGLLPPGDAVPSSCPEALRQLERLAGEAAFALLHDFGDHESFELTPEGLPALEEFLDAVGRGDPTAVSKMAREAAQVVTPTLQSLHRGNQREEAARRTVIALIEFFSSVVGRMYLSYSVSEDGNARMSIFADFLHRFFDACHEKDSRLAPPSPSFVNETLVDWRKRSSLPGEGSEVS